eukprot:7382452-Prymnesium_polylepis.2
METVTHAAAPIKPRSHLTPLWHRNKEEQCADEGTKLAMRMVSIATREVHAARVGGFLVMAGIHLRQIMQRKYFNARTMEILAWRRPVGIVLRGMILPVGLQSVDE